jgi:hypothetical protein
MNEIHPLEERIKNLTVGLSGMTDSETIKVNKAFLSHVKDDMTQLLEFQRAQLEQQKNKPLTLEELRQMGGEPVWVECFQGINSSRWIIVKFNEICGITCMQTGENAYSNIEVYKKSWLAYRHKKEDANV